MPHASASSSQQGDPDTGAVRFNGWMEQLGTNLRLTTDPEDADVVVDLLNVGLQLFWPGLTPLDRVGASVRLWGDYVGETDPGVLLVADRSYHALLPPFDASRLQAWHEAGLAEIEPSADERILTLAEAFPHLSVLTFDRYVGHRRDFPWLQANQTRFFDLFQQRDGTVAARQRDMGVDDSVFISSAAEIDTLKANRLIDGRRPDLSVVDYYWQCPHRSCPWFSADTSTGQPLPFRDRGRVVCRLHGKDLKRLGPKPSAVQVIFQTDGKERARATLVAGSPPLVLGRTSAAGVVGIGEHLTGERNQLLSRRHLALRFSAGEVVVRDLGSSNGTDLISGDVSRRLPSDVDVTLAPRDRLILAGCVTIRVSGRRYATGSVSAGTVGEDNVPGGT